MDDGGAGVEVGEVDWLPILCQVLLDVAAVFGFVHLALLHAQARDTGVYGEGIRVDRVSIVIHFRRIVQRIAFVLSGIFEVQLLRLSFRRFQNVIPRPAIITQLTILQRGHNVVQGHVDAVVHRKLQHRAHKAAHAAGHLDAVIHFACIRIDAGAIHNDLHKVVVDGIAIRHCSFFDPVSARLQIIKHDTTLEVDPVLVHGEPCGFFRGLRLGIFFQYYTAVIGYFHIIVRIQCNRCAVDRIAGYAVNFLHRNAVDNVRNVQPRRHLAFKVTGVLNGVGVLSCRICQGIRFAEIVADAEILALAAKVLILLNLPRQAVDLNLVSAGSGKDKHIRLLSRRLYGSLNPGFTPNRPTPNGRAGHRVPFFIVILLFHHGKHGATVQLI